MTKLIDNYPPDSLLIEIRGIYDGWSVIKLPTGEYINRWKEGDRRYQPTQNWINRQCQSQENQNTSTIQKFPPTKNAPGNT